MAKKPTPKKLSADNIAEFAPSNPYLDMRQWEKYLAMRREMARLGIDLSRPRPSREQPTPLTPDKIIRPLPSRNFPKMTVKF